MVKQIFATLTLILLCLQIAACSSVGTEKPALAFISSDRYDINTQIYLVNADGNDLRRLVQDEGRSDLPAWSPDGYKIAYSHEKDGNWDIYVMDVGKGDDSRLTSDPGMDNAPTWSPDGSKIAFMSNRSGTFQLYVMESDGKNQQRLFDSKEHVGFPYWSPDGHRMAFMKDFPKGKVVCVLDIDSGNQSCPLAEIYDVNALAWAPDGTRLAFSTFITVYVSDLADGSTKVLASSAWNPAWSPSGGQIAYICSSGTFSKEYPFHDLCVMNSDGTDQRRVGQLNPNWRVWDGPVWLPDGNKLAFIIGDGKERAVYVIGSDGLNLKRITGGWYSIEYPVWAPRL